MPNSLRARLKNLVYKGVLTQKDLDRIEIIPTDENEKALKAARVIKEYCQSIDCKKCVFYLGDRGCSVYSNSLPETWEIKEEGGQDG